MHSAQGTTGNRRKGTETMARVLLGVDLQLGFINDFTRHIPGRVRRLIERELFEPVLFTRFVNAADGPYHRFLDWHACADPPETELVPELDQWTRPEHIFPKLSYTGLPDDLKRRLREMALGEITIVGIDTDMCVLKVAMDVFDLGIRPIVLVDCCASTGGLQAHLAGLAVLARNIGAHQLRDAGLDGGYLGAPPE